MESEVLIVIITVGGNILITLASIFANIYITKVSNADKLHEFKRHLTSYEIKVKPVEWIIATVEDDDALHRYDKLTKNGILRRYKKIKGKMDDAIKDAIEKELEKDSILAMAMGPKDIEKEKSKDDDNGDPLDW